jgi:hypothetical protein
MSYLIVGANGNFSTQLQEILMIKKSMVIDKDLYGNWENFDSKLYDRIAHICQKFNLNYLINTVGIISKKHSPDFIRYWNYLFPKHLYSICTKLNLNIVTLGSIHETVPNMCVGNPYLESKKALELFLKEKNFENSVHFQFHTWYGGRKIHPEMFLGQIIESIKNKTAFVMSDGKQLREYHHVFDDAVCLLENLSNGVKGPQNISHGEIFTLKDIAIRIYQYFGCEDLLKLNAIKSTHVDITDKSYLVQKICNCRFRPTMKGVLEYVEKNI